MYVILGKRRQIFSIAMAPDIRYKTNDTNGISFIKRRMENVLEQRGNFPISSFWFSMRFHAYRTYKWKYIFRAIFVIQLSTSCSDIRHGLAVLLVRKNILRFENYVCGLTSWSEVKALRNYKSWNNGYKWRR